MKAVLKELGELRIMLVGAALFTIALVPFTTGGEVRLEGLGLLPDVLAPVVGIILVFVLLLDMLMSRVFMGSLDKVQGKRFRTAILVEGVVLVLMIASWYPYFKRMVF